MITKILFSLAAIEPSLYVQHLDVKRKARRCRNPYCNSENVRRFHTMRHHSGRWYWTSTWSVCEDCGLRRVDKKERLKRFGRVDIFWRLLVYKSQFVEREDGSSGIVLQYCDGDISRRFPMKQYFQRSPDQGFDFRRKPPLPKPFFIEDPQFPNLAALRHRQSD